MVLNGQLLHRDNTKTAGSAASLPLLGLGVSAQARQDADDGWHESGLVFTTKHGTPIEPRNFNRSFEMHCRKAGVPRIRVHDTRHTCASLLATLDVHPRVAMRILRHSQIAVTMNVYTQVPSPETCKALKRLNKRLTRSCISLLYKIGKGPPGSSERAFHLWSRLGDSNPRPLHYEIPHDRPQPSTILRRPSSGITVEIGQSTSVHGRPWLLSAPALARSRQLGPGEPTDLHSLGSELPLECKFFIAKYLPICQVLGTVVYMETNDLDPAAALAQAERLKTMMNRHSRWVVYYQLMYGAASFAMVLALGLLEVPLGVIVSSVIWILAIAALSIFAARQPVSYRGMAKTHYVMIGTWTILYGIVLFLGLFLFPGDLAWWLPGAALVAAPGLVTAYVTYRRVWA
ncbi:tyrosine-type recombinase/integrase [Nonomuraea sp. NPDC050536]|uniref:site-specific integrase n=1 Tax=Nonomuraea sp. NPDC050536 TaxID=3364366 RepID=UPI0037C7F7C6